MVKHREWYISLFPKEHYPYILEKTGKHVAGFRNLKNAPPVYIENEIQRLVKQEKLFISAVMRVLAEAQRLKKEEYDTLESLVQAIEVRNLNRPEIIIALIHRYFPLSYDRMIDQLRTNIENNMYIFHNIEGIDRDPLEVMKNTLKGQLEMSLAHKVYEQYLEELVDETIEFEDQRIYQEIKPVTTGEVDNLIQQIRSSNDDPQYHFLYYIAFFENKTENKTNSAYKEMFQKLQHVVSLKRVA
ncbi:MAG: hypothetical protein ACRC5C_06440, partial [Bacilli bacterium]